MMCKLLFQIVLLMFPTIGFTQDYSSWQDSIQKEAKVFFAEVDKIELVKLKPSYSTEEIVIDSLGNTEEIPVEWHDESIILDHTAQGTVYPIDSSRIGRKYTLKPEEYDLLFGMLYDGTPSFRRASCYNPRHGITFYNSAGGLIGFLEICFECNQMYALSSTPNMGPLEGEPFKNLKLFFARNNLIDPGDDDSPPKTRRK